MARTAKMIAAAAQAFAGTLAAAQGRPPATLNPTTRTVGLQPTSVDFPHVGKMPGASAEMKQAYRDELKRRRKAAGGK